LALFAATLVYLVGALGLGILISTLADSQAIAFQGGLLVSLLPAVLLSRSLPLSAATLVYLVGALGLGILISTLADSQAIAFQGGLLVSLLPAVLLSRSE